LILDSQALLLPSATVSISLRDPEEEGSGDGRGGEGQSGEVRGEKGGETEERGGGEGGGGGGGTSAQQKKRGGETRMKGQYSRVRVTYCYSVNSTLPPLPLVTPRGGGSTILLRSSMSWEEYRKVAGKRLSKVSNFVELYGACVSEADFCEMLI